MYPALLHLCTAVYRHTNTFTACRLSYFQFPSQSIFGPPTSTLYLCCNHHEDRLHAAVHVLYWVMEAEWRAGTFHIAQAVNVAELVELRLFLGQVVF